MMTKKELHTCCVRFLYYGWRIAAEFFHSVTDGTGGMISYNHYAAGAVGDFLYRRIAGLEATAPGYRSFAVKPVLGGGLTAACASVETPYGKAASDWKIEDGTFTLNVTVPVNTDCTVTLPDGTVKTAGSGTYTYTCAV